MEVLGHRDLKMTQRYISSTTRRVATTSAAAIKALGWDHQGGITDSTQCVRMAEVPENITCGRVAQRESTGLTSSDTFHIVNDINTLAQRYPQYFIKNHGVSDRERDHQVGSPKIRSVK